MQLEVYESTVYRAGELQAEEAAPRAAQTEMPKLDTSVALWLILFVFGGGLLALYYAGIGYFPEVTWQDALTYMALMTIIGGSLLVAYSFLLFVPGAIWSELLIYDRQLRRVLMMDARAWEPCVWSVMKKILFPFALFMVSCHFLLFMLSSKGEPNGLVAAGVAASLTSVAGLLWRDLWEGLDLVAGKNVVRKIARYRLSVAVCHIPLFAVFIHKCVTTGHHQGGDAHRTVLWVAALLPLVSFAGLLIDRGRERRREFAGGTGHSVPDKLSLLCRAILAFCVAALLSLAALWFFYRIYRSTAPGALGRAHPAPLSLLILCTLVVIVANLAVSSLFHEHRRPALMASFLAALLLLGAGQLLPEKGASLPVKIMESFGFGVQNATLVLTERGGRLLCAQAIPVKLEKTKQTTTGLADDFCARAEAPAEPGEEEKTKESLTAGKVETQKDPQAAVENKPRKEILARAEKVTILSRLGSEYLLRFEGQNKKTITAVLPKSEVVSWSIAGATGG